MNSDIIKGKWKQLAGLARKSWAKLVRDDLAVVEAHLECLVGKLQERSGWAKHRAVSQINKFERSL